MQTTKVTITVSEQLALLYVGALTFLKKTTPPYELEEKEARKEMDLVNENIEKIKQAFPSSEFKSKVTEQGKEMGEITPEKLIENTIYGLQKRITKLKEDKELGGVKESEISGKSDGN